MTHRRQTWDGSVFTIRNQLFEVKDIDYPPKFESLRGKNCKQYYRVQIQSEIFEKFKISKMINFFEKSGFVAMAVSEKNFL